jgi:hypothetical protein
VATVLSNVPRSRILMPSVVRTLTIFVAGVVLAFVWGVYYVVTSVAGFSLDLTLVFLAPTAVVVAGIGVIELYTRRRRGS